MKMKKIDIIEVYMKRDNWNKKKKTNPPGKLLSLKLSDKPMSHSSNIDRVRPGSNDHNIHMPRFSLPTL